MQYSYLPDYSIIKIYLMIKRIKNSIPFEYRIPLIYILIGSLWILFSDEFVLTITKDPHRILILSTYKGWFYVIVTGIMLFYHIQREINRRILLYNELLEAKDKAEESVKLKSTFLSNLSHYIRTPMNGILGFVSLLQNKDTSPENNERFLGYINERSQNLLETLNNIIEISKLQEGQSEVKTDAFSINNIINNIISSENIEFSLSKKSIRIVTDFYFQNNDDSLISDSVKVSQIVSNLLSNAVAFSNQGEIIVRYIIKENTIQFSIIDCGTGISKEKQEKLMNDFMHLNSYTYTLGEGAGLGLYLASEYSKLLGGRLWLEKSDENGSVFCFCLPYYKS